MCNSGCTRAIDMNPKVEIIFSTIKKLFSPWDFMLIEPVKRGKEKNKLVSGVRINEIVFHFSLTLLVSNPSMFFQISVFFFLIC
jgi:hypothetical protein